MSALTIANNVAANLASLSLDRVQSSLTQTVSSLSTGLRIQKAGDDPSGLVITNLMGSNITGMQQATSNNEQGISMLQTADGAIQQISNALTQIRGLAIDAANAALQTPDSLSALQESLDQSISSITTLANNTQFSNQTLLNGSFSGDTIAPSSQAVISSITQDATKLPGDIQAGSTLTATVTAPTVLSRSNAQVTLTGTSSPLSGDTPLQGLTQNGTVLAGVAGTSYTVTGPLGTQGFTLSAGSTINDIVGEVNAYTASTGVQANYDPNTGALTMESTGFGNGAFSVTSQDMSGTGANVGLLDSDTTGATTNTNLTPATNQTLSLQYTNAAGVAQSVTLTEDPTSSGGLTFTNTAGGPELVPPYSSFDPGAFSVTLNDTTGGTFGSSMSVAASDYTATRVSNNFIQSGGQSGDTTLIDIPDMRAGALGHTAGLASSGFASLQDLDTNAAFTNGDADQALQVIDAAINEVSLANGNLGSIQSDSLQSALTNLQSSSTNLTDAQSKILDTDVASESALYANQSIVYQAATAMLAQANQIPQTVLHLLTGS